jgi:Spy/CpxP family protein refolding chaperone
MAKMQKSRFLWILLIASLALNVCFVGGALYFRMVAGELRHSPEARAEYMADRLNLDSAQTEALKQTREKVIALRENSSDDRDERRKDVWAIIAAPQFDREALRTLIERGHGERLERWLDTSQILHDYLATLTPEQRAAFVEMAQDRDFFRRFFGDRKQRD